MNPFDAIGTARVSQAIADRICRIVLGYQDAAAERGITAAVTGRSGPVTDFAVGFARATRSHPDVRMGASVRGAIDLVLLIDGLARLRGEEPMSRCTARDAAHAALSGRIRLADGTDRSPESVLDELLDQLWPDGASQPPEPAADGDQPAEPDQRGQPGGQGKADGPRPAAGRQPQRGSRSSLRRERTKGPARRTISRAELASAHDGFAGVSPAAGSLDTSALADLLAADPDAAAALLADLSRATDAQLRALAGRLATRIFIQLGGARWPPARGPRRIRPVLRGDGDIDLDRTLDRLAGSWPPPAEEVVTTTWRARHRTVCLLVDSSGSMSGLALAMAAVATASVLLAAGARLDTGALAFAGEVTVLQPPGSRQPPEQTVSALLGLRGHGLTDLAAALRAASAQLAAAARLGAVAPGERRVVLLSDCVSTAGGDPAAALAGIDRLDVLCPVPGAGASPAAEVAAARLARLGGGISMPLRTLSDVPSALTRLLAS
jgi:magnesium chelatase subunit D